MSYTYLPGMQVFTVDGGLAAKRTPTSKLTIAIGTSAQGPADTPYLVTDRAAAAQVFGLQGTLIQTMEELAQAGCDNIYLFRMGTVPATLTGIGQVNDSNGNPIDINNIGYTITFGQIQSSVSSIYQVYYDGAGILQIFLSGNLVYSNDPVNPVDTSDSIVTGTAVGGNPIKLTGAAGASAYTLSVPLSNSLISASTAVNVPAGGGAVTSITPDAGTGEGYTSVPTVSVTGANGTGTGFAGTAVLDGNGNVASVTITAPGAGYVAPLTVTFSGGGATVHATATATASAITSEAEVYPALTLKLGDSGMAYNQSYNPCDVYEKIMRAFDILSMVPVQEVVVPNCYFDTPSVAFYSASAPATDPNNPANGLALGWLKSWRDNSNTLQFHWAHRTYDSTGTTVAPATFVSPSDRITQDYHEVSFGYALARFCASQSQDVGGCLGFIGTTPPKNYQPSGLAAWIGQLPTVDANGNAATPGAGLLGNPYLRGTTSEALNPLVNDVQTKIYRIPGLYQTTSADDETQFGEYDEAIVVDANGYLTDMGAYIQVVNSWALLSNGVSTGYKNNIACVVAGFCSALDEKSALTNKTLPAVSQIYRLPARILDKLTFAKLNELRYKSDTTPAVLLHDRSAANDNSDYIFLLTQRIKFLVETTLHTVIDPYVGVSATDGLAMSAMQTAIDKNLSILQKASYLSGYSYNVSTTTADRRVGRIFLQVTFIPANELVQVMTTITAGQ